MFSTFTASTGRAGASFSPARSSPVSGQGVGLPRRRVHDGLDRLSGALPGEREHGQHDDDGVAGHADHDLPRWVNATE